MNRKAMMFLAGIVALLLLALFWIAKNIGSCGKDKVEPPRQASWKCPNCHASPSEEPPLPTELPPTAAHRIGDTGGARAGCRDGASSPQSRRPPDRQ